MSKSKFLIIYGLFVTAFLTGYLGAQLLILLSGLFIVGYIAINSTKNQRNINIIFWIVVIYPLLELLIKIMLIYDIVPYSWVYLNRMEHAIFSGILTILLYTITKNFKTVTNKYFLYLIIISFINLLGVINEFMEYFIREYYNHYSRAYYWDTISDLIVNVVTATIVIFVIYFYEHRKVFQRKTPSRLSI